MYELTEVLARRKIPGARYEKITNKDVLTVEALLQDYRDIYLGLTHYTEPDVEMALSFKAIEELLYTTDREMTVQAWLASLGDMTLPVTHNGLTLVSGRVHHTDLLDIGFRAVLVDDKYQESTNRHREEMAHVRLLDYSNRYLEYGSNCLFTCNGLLHRHDYSEEGIFLDEVGRSTDLEDRIQLSALSFKELGGVTIYPITPEMIKRHNGGRYQDGFYIEVPDQDFSNKTVMLSICGLLHYNNQDYSVISGNTLKVHWSHIHFDDRYVDLRHKIDFYRVRDLIDKTSEDGNTYINRTAAESDEVILEVLQLSQTFIIVVNTDNISYDKFGVERTHLPGRFLTHTPPTGPVMLANGQIHSTRVRKESGHVHSLIMAENWMRNEVEHTRGPHSSPNTMVADVSRRPRYMADGYMMDIFSEVIVT